MKIFISLILTSLTLQAETLTLFVGSSGSHGIHTTTFNTETGKISPVTDAKGQPNSGFLAISADKKFLYSTATQDRKGAIASYSILPDNTLKLISTVPTGGNGTCHISTDKTGTCLFSADYGSGHLTSYKVDNMGRISPAVSIIKLEGKSTHPKRQKGPHAHSIYPSPDNKHIYSADLGTDQINIYNLDPKTATLTPNSHTKVPAGSGPRHLAIHPGGTTIYSLNELTCTVSTLSRNPKSGTLTLLHTTPLFPEKTQGISCSEIHLTADNKHLYTGNRDIKQTTRNSISHLTVPQDLTQPPVLKQTLNHTEKIQIPRHFTVTPKGNWLLAGGQRSNNLTAIKRNPKTGQLTLTENSTPNPSPACILIK